MYELSIIVPVYNTEKYIRQCIDSILNQEFQNFELLLIDDGSTDLSGDICDEYANKDNRIVVFHKSNGGQSSARNIGIDNAKGNYIGFVDSDDWIHKDMYAKLLKKSIETNSEIVACNISLMLKNGTFRKYSGASENYQYDKISAMKEVFRNQNLTFSPCNKIYKKTLFDNLRFNEKIILEDKDLSYQLIDKCYRVYYLHEAYYYYRYNQDSTLRSKFNLKRIDEYYVQKKMYEYYLKKYPSFSHSVYKNVFETGTYLFSNIIAEKEYNQTDYLFLIEFDKDILRQILIEDIISLRDKIKIIMFIIMPKILMSILALKCKLRKSLLRTSSLVRDKSRK